MSIEPFSFGRFVNQVRSFHGAVAPGVVLGGIMLEYARRHLPEDCIFDVVCETRACLPDAVQILTPCTIGNGWLKVLPWGRFALSLFDKYTGDGVRCYLDPAKTRAWPELHSWFMKLKPKDEQDSTLILDTIKTASFSICGLQNIWVNDLFRKTRKKGHIAICPSCHEAYPEKDGSICLGCQATDPDAYYLEDHAFRNRRLSVSRF